MRRSCLLEWEVKELEERGIDPQIIQAAGKAAMKGMKACGCGSLYSIENGSCPDCAFRNGTGLDRVREPVEEYMKGYRKRKAEAETCKR